LSQVILRGGTVVVPSRQRAHAARLAHAAAELAKGHRVWATPDILSVDAWLTREVERYAASAGVGVPRLLSPAEEWFLWRQCAAEATGELELVNRGALAEALRRASATAAEYGIDVQSFATAGLGGSPGEGDDMAPGTEVALLATVQHAVDERCQAMGAATVAALLERLDAAGGEVFCQGFLTHSPRLRRLVGTARTVGGDARVEPRVVIASDELDELERIARWCRERVERDPEARILVALPGAPGSRERLATLIRQAVNPAEWFEGATAGSGTGARPGLASEPTMEQRKPGARSASDSLVVIEGGAPLARIASVAHILATLQWLGGSPGDFEAVSSWLRAPYWQAPGAVARARLDLWLRERERMHFNLHDLVGALASAPAGLSRAAREISSQINRAAVALGQGAASAREWSERFLAVLEVFDWPGERARGSGEQQTVVRLHELLDEFGQLAAATRSISRDNAIQWLTELASRTAYRPADDDAVITITATLAAPVVTYDAIWIAGLHAEAFPQPVQPDPFLPLPAQLAAGVPAASPGGRLLEAQALLAAWREGAGELVLSAPARAEDLELLPSPLLAPWLEAGGEAPRHGGVAPVPAGVERTIGARRRMPGKAGGETGVAEGGRGAGAGEHDGAGEHGGAGAHGGVGARDVRDSMALSSSVWLPLRAHREGLLETVDDFVGPAWPTERPLPSGTRTLELQNQCPFRAYAELRLGSVPLDAPELGIAADLRGQLLHNALQKLWQRLRDSRGLAAHADAALEVLITRCVEEAADETLRRHPGTKPRAKTNDAQGDLFGDPSRSPALTREIRRTVRLIQTLCALERERTPFRVEGTELDTSLTLSGAQLHMRIDRVDALESGGRAILDYKSGRRKTTDWYGERPSHPQLLAYLAALGEDIVAMGTVNVTAREVRFDGIATAPELLPKLKGVEVPFGTSSDQAWPFWRREWLSRIERLAAGFVAGRAAVDPKAGACDYCHVASVCRIADQQVAGEVEVAHGDE
jgi:RecB family exonuclease